MFVRRCFKSIILKHARTAQRGLRGEVAVSGINCRVVYLSLTINVHFEAWVPRTDIGLMPVVPDPLRDSTMRIYGPNGANLASPAATARRSSSTTFTLDIGTAAETRSAAPPRAASGIDALLAMQGVEDSVERRKRSVARGRTALDVLDDLKIGLLAGSFDSNTVARLRTAAADLKTTSGDPGLDQVLSEIELRVEVELAKAGQ